VTCTAEGKQQFGLLGEVAGLSLGTVLGAWAGLRRGKAVHPDGVVFDARLVISGDSAAPSAARLLADASEHRAIVRFSRSLGVPRPVPDLLGMSIRVLDAYGNGQHQDLLIVTSADYPILHHFFLPASDVQQRPYSSSLPYQAGNDTFLVGAMPDSRSPRPEGGNEFDRLDAAASTGRLVFRLCVAPIRGPFRPVGELHIGGRLSPDLDALRFNPWNTGGGMQPVGWLNEARDRAYKLSQLAWAVTRKGAAGRQRNADRELHALTSVDPGVLSARDRSSEPSVH